MYFLDSWVELRGGLVYGLAFVVWTMCSEHEGGWRPTLLELYAGVERKESAVHS